MMGDEMQNKKFFELLSLYPKALESYCRALKWDYNKFKTCISDEGISHPDLYLEDPNRGIIEKISQFLEPTNPSSVFIIWDEVGMGKSSIRDFICKSLEKLPNYKVLIIKDPRLTVIQILKIISGHVDIEKSLSADSVEIREELKKRLVEIVSSGVRVVIWIDEAEKIDKSVISELRALSDLRTEDGSKVCKLFLSGTPKLIKKIEEYLETDQDDVDALDDRVNINTFKLNRWKKEDIVKYWQLISNYCGKTNPFSQDAAEIVYEVSEGKPRTIAQITKMAIN
ncbi:MAG: AAA family ATPase, partial [Candidatus Hydrothermarchaeaceae archaeon]